MLVVKRETNMKAMRTRKNQAAYDKYLASLPLDAPCVFCGLNKGDDQFITESKYFKIVSNRFPYDRWDGHKVAEHIMIVPKQHTDTLKDLSFIESKEYVQLISTYEFEGYNIYARTPGSSSKSIIHQHTHLIKFTPKTVPKTLFVRTKLLAKSFGQR
jgi:diadenosine tetraphosphate (Ap4A) HIT family hydrolase